MIEWLLNFIARAVAGLFALVFVLGTCAWLIARSADLALLDPLTYELALAEHDTYLKLPDLVVAESATLRASLARDLADGDPTGLAEGLAPTVFASLEPQDWHNLTTLLLPAALVQRTTEQAIDDAFAWLTLRADSVTVDLKPLKENAAGRAGTRAVEILAGALPECGEPGCPGPERVNELFAPATVLATIPDSLRLDTDAAATASDPQQDPRQLLATARMVIAYLPLALGVVLVIAALFGARSRVGWLRWTGVPLFFAGAITLASSFAAHPALDLIWANALVTDLHDGFTPATQAQIHAVAGSVLDELVRHLQFFAGVVTLIGLVLVLMSFFVSANPSHARR